MENKNKLKTIAIGMILLFGVIIYFTIGKDENYENIYIDNMKALENVSNSSNIEEVEKIKIHIIGEVNNPGIYEVLLGSRIQDVIIAAGGQTKDADLDKVNLAYELEDGQKIRIPSIFDEKIAYIYNDSGENVIENNENTESVKINLNKATLEELQKINGVGPSLAEKIISYRKENGKFKSIEDLKNVSGIGEKKYESIKEYVQV